MDNIFIRKILLLAAKYEIHEELYWDEDLCFFIICNDLFFWATADCEKVDKNTIAELEQALIDSNIWGSLLYCARQRKMRPQGVYYKHIDKEFWHLFDDCGPKRKISTRNPGGNGK